MLSHLQTIHSIADVVNKPGSDVEIIEDDEPVAGTSSGTSSVTVSTARQ
jgi:hypothetical protein